MNAVVEMTPEPRRPGRALAPPTTIDIVQAALKTGNVDLYREAVTLAKELDAIAARKAFDNAMADAKIPVILKNRKVDFTTAKGRTNYRFEDLAGIARTIDPILSEHGLSYRFRVTSNPNEPVSVTCIISHRDGHFEETTLHAGRDESGNKNTIQAVGSTITYLQRYTLKAALGLAVSEDDDGASSEAKAEPAAYKPPPGAVTQDQADQIRDLLETLNVSKNAFLQWAKRSMPTVARIEDVPAEYFDSCIEKIKQVGKPK